MFSVSFGSSGPRRVLSAALLGLFLAATPLTASAAEVEHVVSRGQNLVGIARRYRVTVDAIREVNGIHPRERLHPGQRLVIPERGKEAEAARRAAALRKDADKKNADKKATADKRGADRKGAADKKGEKDGAGAGAGGKEKGYARKPKRPGLVKLVRGVEEVELQLLTRSGRLNPKALPKLSHLLRAPAGSTAIDPRLATLLGMVSDHFGGRTIRVVSGFRPYSPTQYTRHSNHNLGRAVDFAVEGVPNTVVRDFCRSLRNAGVGYYPNSSFVHLDVRSAKVYWVDYSRPGERPRYSLSAPPPATQEEADDVAHATSGEPEAGSVNTHGAVTENPEKAAGNSSPAVSPRKDGQQVSPQGHPSTASPVTPSTGTSTIPARP